MSDLELKDPRTESTNVDEPVHVSTREAPVVDSAGLDREAGPSGAGAMDGAAGPQGGLLGKVRAIWTDRVGAALLLGLAGVFGLLASNYWLFVGTLGLLLGVTAIGLMILVGWAREISLAQAGLTGMSVYLTGYAYRATDGWGLSFPLAIAVAVGAAVAISVVLALAAVRLAGIYVMVLTLAVQFLIENTVFASGTLSGGLTPQPTPRPDFFFISMQSDQAFFFYSLVWVVGIVVLINRLRKSRFGRAMVLVGADRQAAAVVGVSPWRYKILAFALCGAMAGLAGGLLAPLYRTPPSELTFYSTQSLFYLAIPILAGFSSVAGVVAVAVFFTFGPQVLESWNISPFLLGGIGLAIGTVLGPRGVVNPIKRRVDGWLGGRRLHESRAPVPPRFREMEGDAAWRP